MARNTVFFAISLVWLVFLIAAFAVCDHPLNEMDRQGEPADLSFWERQGN
jgi:hypothetical protein